MSITFTEAVGNDKLKDLRIKYDQFLENLNEPHKPQIQTFDPLGPVALAQLQLVRDVSVFLQKKKDDERNAAEAKRVAEAKAEADKPKEQ